MVKKVNYNEVLVVYTSLSTYLSGYAYYYFRMLDVVNGWRLTQMTKSFIRNYINNNTYTVS